MLTKSEQKEYLACLRRAVELARLGGYRPEQVRVDFTLLLAPPRIRDKIRASKRGTEALGSLDARRDGGT